MVKTIAVARIKRMGSMGYMRLSPTFWREVVMGGQKKLSVEILGEICRFVRIADTPLPIQKIGGTYFFSREDQMATLRGYEEAQKRLSEARRREDARTRQA